MKVVLFPLLFADHFIFTSLSDVPGGLVGDTHGQITILQALSEVRFKGVIKPGKSLECAGRNEKEH